MKGGVIHGKCGTLIPNEKLTFDLEGDNCKVRGRCPVCKTYGHIGTVDLTDEQYCAAYHDILPIKRFQMVKVVNHNLWVADSSAQRV